MTLLLCEISLVVMLIFCPPTLGVIEEAIVSPAEQVEETDAVELQGIAKRIADCESGLRQANGRAVEGSYGTHLENTSGPGGTPISTASGLFHFIDATWTWVNGEIGGEQYSRALYAPESVQLEAFYWLYDEGRGAYHWDASRSCWE